VDPAQEQPSAQEKVLIQVYTLMNDHTPVEELAKAVSNSVAWKDRVELEINRTDEWESAQTPYGTIRENTIVVCGEHMIRGNDYWALTKALEDCVNPMPI
jgi:diphthamide biosynthesis methyltransferase